VNTKFSRGFNNGYGVANDVLAPISMYSTLHNSELSSTRMTYDLVRDGAPFAISMATRVGLLGAAEAEPVGWIATVGAAIMYGGELTYDHVIAPTINYISDYSTRWGEWFSNGGYINFYSDQRLKTNITKVDSTLDKILLLHAYRFRWNNNPNNYDIGLIAQEVERVFPELILIDSLGYKKVAYHKFVPILLEAIKEQDSIINRQNIALDKYDKQLKEQEIQLNDVIQRIEKIEKNK